MAACSGESTDDLWRLIDFQMTDATSHNLQVGEIVSEKVGVDEAPDHLLCQVHPSLCFTRVLQKVW